MKIDGIKKLFSDLVESAKNNDFTEMMKNSDDGYSMKKFAAAAIVMVFLYLQIAHWSEANGIAMLGLDAGLITSILITHAVQENQKAKNDKVPDAA